MEKQLIELDQIGYASWLEFYQELVKDDIHKEDVVALTWPDDDRPEIRVKLERVKSGSFDEIFPLLPTPETMEQFRLLLSTIDTTSKEWHLLLDFFNKIPTRAK